MNKTDFLANLHEVGLKDLDMVGGKNASLGEMLQNLTKLGIQIPGGFIITVAAYQTFIRENKLDETIHSIINGINFEDIESLRRGGLHVRQLIKNSKFPQELSKMIIAKYYELSKIYDQEETDVAVRSSATAEDLPDASFAGQQETYLNVRGPASLINSVRNCFASLFTDRAISYRQSFGYDHFDIGLSVCVQKMVRSDLAASGVAFSLDTESGFKNVVVINASFGLGEMIVQGSVSPDEYIVFKPTLKEGYKSVIEKKLGNKDRMMVYGDNPDERVQIIPVERALQQRYCLTNDRILELAEWVVKIEEYYSQLKKHWCPMDVEWAVDGLTKELFIVQARPETIHSQKDHSKISGYLIDESTPRTPLFKGIAVGDKIATGKVSILYSLDKRV